MDHHREREREKKKKNFQNNEFSSIVTCARYEKEEMSYVVKY